MKLTIIVPAHNEEDNIADVINRIERSIDIAHELIVVNDHSSDRTAELVRNLTGVYANLLLVENTRDMGFANAIKTGFKNVSSEVVLPIMGDLCDELGVVKAMLDKIDQGYDLVCGSRYIKGGARIGGPRVKGLLSRFAGCSLYYLLGIPTHDIANSFKMYRKDVIDSIEIEATGFEISMEITLKAHYRGFKVTEVPTVWNEREKGKSSFKIFKLLPKYLKFYFWAISKRVRG